MREIKFRAKTLINNKGAWAYGDLEYCKQSGLTRIHTYKEDGSYDKQQIVDPDTVGQYTGLKDCNGKEIYEGDILKVAFERFVLGALVEENYTVKVVFVDCEFLGDAIVPEGEERGWNMFYLWENDDEIMVIGNVYDNPELLSHE